MPTHVGGCGFEAGTSALTGSQLPTLSGTDFSFETTTPITGLRSGLYTVTSGGGGTLHRVEAAGFTVATRIFCFSLALRFNTALPTNSTQLLAVRNTLLTEMQGIGYNAGTGNLECFTADTYGAAAFTWGGGGFTPVVGVVYHITVKINTTANPSTVDMQVNGTAVTQLTKAIAAWTPDQVTIGLRPENSNATASITVDDMVYSQTAADYPMPRYVCYGHVLDSDGTHNTANTADNFERGNTGTDIIDSTTNSYLLVDDRPLPTGAVDEADCIREVLNIPTNTWYTENQFANSFLGAVPVPVSVEGVVVNHEIATGTCIRQIRLRDTNGGTEATIYSSTGAGATAYRYTRAHYGTIPGGGAWTVTAFNAMVVRFGYSSDANPDVCFDGAMLEAFYLPPNDPLFEPKALPSSLHGLPNSLNRAYSRPPQIVEPVVVPPFKPIDFTMPVVARKPVNTGLPQRTLQLIGQEPGDTYEPTNMLTVPTRRPASLHQSWSDLHAPQDATVPPASIIDTNPTRRRPVAQDWVDLPQPVVDEAAPFRPTAQPDIVRRIARLVPDWITFDFFGCTQVTVLRPESAITNLWSENSGTPNWAMVSDISDASYIQASLLSADDSELELFASHPVGFLNGIHISKVTVFVRARRIAAEAVSMRIAINIAGVVYSPSINVTDSLVDYSYEWPISPLSGGEWVYSELDPATFQFGVESGPSVNDALRVTEIWVEITHHCTDTLLPLNTISTAMPRLATSRVQDWLDYPQLVDVVVETPFVTSTQLDVVRRTARLIPDWVDFTAGQLIAPVPGDRNITELPVRRPDRAVDDWIASTFGQTIAPVPGERNRTELPMRRLNRIVADWITGVFGQTVAPVPGNRNRWEPPVRRPARPVQDWSASAFQPHIARVPSSQVTALPVVPTRRLLQTIQQQLQVWTLPVPNIQASYNLPNTARPTPVVDFIRSSRDFPVAAAAPFPSQELVARFLRKPPLLQSWVYNPLIVLRVPATTQYKWRDNRATATAHLSPGGVYVPEAPKLASASTVSPPEPGKITTTEAQPNPGTADTTPETKTGDAELWLP